MQCVMMCLFIQSLHHSAVTSACRFPSATTTGVFLVIDTALSPLLLPVALFLSLSTQIHQLPYEEEGRHRIRVVHLNIYIS